MIVALWMRELVILIVLFSNLELGLVILH